MITKEKRIINMGFNLDFTRCKTTGDVEKVFSRVMPIIDEAKKKVIQELTIWGEIKDGEESEEEEESGIILP